MGLSQGEKVVESVITVVTDCPPETGWTSAERGGGGLKGERRDNDNQRFVSHAKTAKTAEIYSLSYFTLALEWSQTSLRQSAQRVLSTPSPLRGTTPGVETDPSPTCPRVALGSAPLPRHRSTFSASSEDLARPQVEGVVTTTCPHISRTLYSPPLWRMESLED